MVGMTYSLWFLFANTYLWSKQCVIYQRISGLLALAVTSQIYVGSVFVLLTVHVIQTWVRINP